MENQQNILILVADQLRYPYGAQMLVAISACAEMGVQLSAFDIMGYLYYPYLLLVSSLVAIFVIKEKKK